MHCLFYRKDATSGIYYLLLNGKTVVTYCHMEKICGKTGWTMIMKIDGHKVCICIDHTIYQPGAWDGNPRGGEGKVGGI